MQQTQHIVYHDYFTCKPTSGRTFRANNDGQEEYALIQVHCHNAKNLSGEELALYTRCVTDLLTTLGPSYTQNKSPNIRYEEIKQEFGTIRLQQGLGELVPRPKTELKEEIDRQLEEIFKPQH